MSDLALKMIHIQRNKLFYKMNQRRKNEKRRIHDEVRIAEGHVRHNRDAVDRLKKATVEDPVFTATRIEKLECTAREMLLSISKLHQREQDLGRGLIDEELRAEAKLIKDELDSKVAVKQKKKDKEREEDAINKASSQDYWNATVKAERGNRYDKKNFAKEYTFFQKFVSSIPKYIQEILKNCPNNKGYIWKGVHNFGERPAQKGRPIELEEPVRGKQNDRVHEWTTQSRKDLSTFTVYRLYEKVGRGRDTKRYLLHEEEREPIPWACNSAVFWK